MFFRGDIVNISLDAGIYDAIAYAHVKSGMFIKYESDDSDNMAIVRISKWDSKHNKNIIEELILTKHLSLLSKNNGYEYDDVVKISETARIFTVYSQPITDGTYVRKEPNGRSVVRVNKGTYWTHEYVLDNQLTLISKSKRNFVIKSPFLKKIEELWA